MRIRPYKYTADHVDCTLCTEYASKIGCTAERCPWFTERLEAGSVGYMEAVSEVLSDLPILRRRLRFLLRRFPGTLWLDESHKWRMNVLKTQVGYSRKNTPQFYAAMYLISSDMELFRCAGGCFSRKSLDFSKVVLRRMSPHTYTLLVAAKDVYTGSSGITIEDAACEEIIDNEAFRLIVNAILISRYGLDALKINRRSAVHGV